MEKIKCLAVFAMLVVMAVFSAHSQNANGAELLQKGKDYEAKKEYVYALGSYYDAIEAGGESVAEAITAFETLAGYIREGNPGPGKYNEFTLHDGWVALLQNAEKYWTENCPWQFMFNIGNKTVDYTTRTASYDLVIDAVLYDLEIDGMVYTVTESEISKYGAIVDETIYKGLNKSWKNDWTDIRWNNRRRIMDWSYMSVYQKPQGKYLQNGSALFDRNGDIYCAWKSGIVDTFNSSLYDMKVAVCDLAGKELLKSERILYGEKNNKYTFSGVTPDVMDLIDNKQITIKITDLYLEYGKYNRNDDKGGRTFIKNLPELKLNVSPENGKAYSLLLPDEIITIPYGICRSENGGDFVDKNQLTKIKIPYGVTSIVEDAFKGCESLASVTIPDSVTSIGKESFRGCSSLTSVTIPDSVTTIGRSAFSGCTSLTSVTIPDGVTTIDDFAFSNCSSLTSVTISYGITSIEYRAFYDCALLTSVTIPDSVTSIHQESFNREVMVTYKGTTDTWSNIYYKYFF